MIVRTRPLLYSAAASSASDDHDEIVDDGDGDTLRLQLGCDVVETQREDVEHTAQQIDMSARSRPDAGTAAFALEPIGSVSSSKVTATTCSDRNHHRPDNRHLPTNSV